MIHDRWMAVTAISVIVVAMLVGCGANSRSEPAGSNTDTGAVDGATEIGTGGDAGDASPSSDTEFNPDLGGGDAPPPTYPVRKIPGLDSITYYERSGGTAPPAYKGVDTEFYDVYYSNAAGDFELDGRYLTISGEFGYKLPSHVTTQPPTPPAKP